MDLSSPTKIKEIFEKYEAKASKGLGQNFLADKNILNKIVEAAGINSDDNILEVGPGLGVLTAELAKKAGSVVAVEKDEKMVEILGETMQEFKNVKIIQGDILKDIDFTKFKNYKVVANIPYYLTSPLIRNLLETENPPTEIVLMIQKEVAERITANPPKMSLLAVSVQYYADAKIITNVSKNCFYPAPKIDSAVIKIIPTSRGAEYGPAVKPAGMPAVSELFFKIVKAGFSQPRKQLAGNLKFITGSKGKAEEWLASCGIDGKRRAETLTVEDWKNLTKAYK